MRVNLRLSSLTPVQFTAHYEHNFADDQIVPEDLYSFTVKLLMPKG